MSRKECAQWLGECAQRAALYEVCCTPKPGLVDRRNSGAHRDMDLFTFLDSAAALRPYFRRAAALGMTFEGGETALLNRLRPLGVRAEEEMLRATGGVNTHKGLVFSLGLFCAAAGRCERQGSADIFTLCGKMAALLCGELENGAADAARSHGERIYLQYGLTGIRGEAAAGFPAVREHGLPVLRRGLERGLSFNDAGVVTLLHLIAAAEDTNLIRRAGLDRARELRRELRRLLDSGMSDARLLDTARRLDGEWSARGFSPGGAADLLAITFFVYFWREGREARRKPERPPEAVFPR